MGLLIRITTILVVSICTLNCCATPAAAQEVLPAPAESLPYPATGFTAPPLVLEADLPLIAPHPMQAQAPIPQLAPQPYRLPAVPTDPIPPLPTSDPLPVSIVAPTEDAALADSASIVIDETLPPLVAEPTIVPVTWYQPTTWFRPVPWDTGIELGLNGSAGTSDTLSVRTGGYIKLKTDTRKIDFNLYYNKTNSEGVDTQNNAQLNFRHDWLVGESPWTVYFNTQMFYDEFQAFDLSVNLTTGVGYRWFENEWSSLTTRYGSGASREFGGPDDTWKPEAQFGAEYDRQISKTQKFYAKIDYFPEWQEFGEYRILTDVGLEIQLDRPSNMSLKIAATDRYKSNPDGVEPHNVNYSVLLLWKL